MLTGSEVIVEYLVREGVPYAIGIPGHGNLGLVDALRRRQDAIRTIQVRHEQAAAHLADGYFRVAGRPLAIFTSIGPGAINTVVGVATAYVDSTAMLVLTGNVHTYMRGTGVLQEIERVRWADWPRILEPVVKAYWSVTRVDQLPRILPQAFSAMLHGRPGPVLIDLPMDIQCEAAEVELPLPISARVAGGPGGDPEAIARAADLLWNARRPVILAGGGVILARAEGELRRLAEHLGAAVVTTMMGKGAFPEDHPLYGWHVGANGSTVGNALCTSADVLLAVGCRFSDKTASSYKPGASLAIPPTRLIHVDLDPHEIGKNYPVEVGIIGDARATLQALADAVAERGPARDYTDSEYTAEIRSLREEWLTTVRKAQEADVRPITIARALKELRRVLPEDAMVLTSSGHSQAEVFQSMAFTRPRTYLSAGGFSTMGWSVPAAMGAKLAAPEQPAVAIVGDGDFLQTVQELATAMQYHIPILVVVMNNAGWQSITDLQIAAFGPESAFATRFHGPSGEPTTPHLADVARAFGVEAVRVTEPDELADAAARALKQEVPFVIEVMVNREFGLSGGVAAGWWDVPVPVYLKERYEAYARERARERVFAE